MCYFVLAPVIDAAKELILEAEFVRRRPSPLLNDAAPNHLFFGGEVVSLLAKRKFQRFFFERQE